MTKLILICRIIVVIAAITIITIIACMNPTGLDNKEIYDLSITNISNKEIYQIQEEELNFPIAFSLIIYQDFNRFLRLLKVIYREHNTYCIHVDKKSPHLYYENVKLAAKLIGPHNIYVVSEAERVDVRWGEFTVLEADLICARILYEKNKRWKYFINLTGHEFPLRTNWELVRALRLLNGSNIAMAEYEQRQKWRIPKQDLLNFKVKWYEGPVHIAVRREFVQYMLYNKKALKLLNLIKMHETRMRKLTIPDEQYFHILNNNPQVFSIPGSYIGGYHNPPKYPLITRMKIWTRNKNKCYSHFIRNKICMLGNHDLPHLKVNPHFFANKFIPSVEPEGYDKLEQWLYEKMNYELVHKKLHPTFYEQYYTTFDLSWNHL